MVSIGDDLRGAVARNEIVAYFQPQIELGTGGIVSVEVLSRWRHPTRGLLTAGSYIPEAESTGLIHEIGDFMLDEGCRWAAHWNSTGVPTDLHVDVAVNVSAAQLSTTSFFDRLLGILQRVEIPPHRLIVEITETRAIDNHPLAAQRLERLKDAGVEISIDDFGSGFSSMTQLLSLPATELKLDRSLVQSTVDQVTRTIGTMVELAHRLGLRVVAEGIETDAQLERVRSLGCDRAQGYLIGPAVSEAEMEALLRRTLPRRG
jgi:EAL domain-containing protein (putative c-di-GMP-specific phosphodiesterase class I)